MEHSVCNVLLASASWDLDVQLPNAYEIVRLVNPYKYIAKLSTRSKNDQLNKIIL